MKDIQIIIAEDNMGHSVLLKKNFRRIGINNKIIHFQNGADLDNFFFANQDKTKDNAYILLINDRLPKISGLEIIEKINSEGKNLDVSVILMTTNEDEELVAKCEELNCENLLHKPVDFLDFVEAVCDLGFSMKVVRDDE